MISNVVVEVYNRTDRTLEAIKDGQTFELPPGRSHLRADVIPFAKNQHPVPGTDDGTTFESLISIVAKPGERQRDPLDDLPEEILALLPKERLDRTQLAPNLQGTRDIDFRPLRRAQISPTGVTDGMVDGSHLTK